jgi:hypothetical protein
VALQGFVGQLVHFSHFSITGSEALAAVLFKQEIFVVAAYGEERCSMHRPGPAVH